MFGCGKEKEEKVREQTKRGRNRSLTDVLIRKERAKRLGSRDSEVPGRDCVKELPQQALKGSTITKPLILNFRYPFSLNTMVVELVLYGSAGGHMGKHTQSHAQSGGILHDPEQKLKRGDGRGPNNGEWVVCGGPTGPVAVDAVLGLAMSLPFGLPVWC